MRGIRIITIMTLETLDDALMERLQLRRRIGWEELESDVRVFDIESAAWCMVDE
jgi:hypothetical protein